MIVDAYRARSLVVKQTIELIFAGGVHTHEVQFRAAIIECSEWYCGTIGQVNVNIDDQPEVFPVSVGP